MKSDLSIDLKVPVLYITCTKINTSKFPSALSKTLAKVQLTELQKENGDHSIKFQTPFSHVSFTIQ